jgi:hypothetical protein
MEAGSRVLPAALQPNITKHAMSPATFVLWPPHF